MNAAEYDQFVETKLKHTYRATAVRVLGECGNPQEGICIDLGCGSGHLDVELGRLSRLTIIGLDINGDMKPLFEKRIREAGLEKRVSFTQGDAQKLPFPDDYADVIVSRGMLNFLPDIKRCLQEVDRVLKPTGVAFLGGRYLYAPAEAKVDSAKLRAIVAESGVKGAEFTDDRGQWVKIIGPQASPSARNFHLGPSMLAGRFAADYGLVEGQCLLICRADGPLEQSVQKGFVDVSKFRIIALYPTTQVAEAAAARVRQAGQDSRIECRAGDVHALPFADSTFNAVCGVAGVPFWSDREKAFREIHRVLRPDGVALVGGMYRGMPESRKVSSESLRATGAKAGLKLFQVHDNQGQWVEIRKSEP
jgi:ubiquinone/menaquinone biosynthesis C-methylase UbiE